MNSSQRTIDTRIFFSIPFLLSLSLLFLNDHLGKEIFHNTLTGKLSDFAGLFAFVLFWRALLPGHRNVIAISTAVGFIFWKSPWSSMVIDLWNSLPFGMIDRTVDYTDYIALLVIPLAWRYEPRPLRFVPARPIVWFMGLVAILPLLATSCPRHRPPYRGFAMEEGNEISCEPSMGICRKRVEDENGDTKYLLIDTSGRTLNTTLFDCIRIYDPNGSSWYSTFLNNHDHRLNIDAMRRSWDIQPSERFLEVNIGGDCEENDCEGGSWGIVNTSGTMIVPPEFDAIDGLRNWGMFLVAEKTASDRFRFGLIDSNGRTILQPYQDSIALFGNALIRYRSSAERGGKWGVIAIDRGEVFPPLYDTIVPDFRSGMAQIVENGLWGYLDSTGKVSVRPQFGGAGDFHDGFARVRSMETRQWGFIDAEGRFVVQPAYEAVGNMRQGLAWVRKAGEKIGYINTRGETIIPPRFDSAGDFQRGNARVFVDGERRLIDRKGTWFTHGEPGNGWTIVMREEGARTYGKTRQLYGYMDSTGTVVIEPQFIHASSFSEGLARVQPTDNFLHGYIDSSGTFVIPAIYRYSGNFHEGLAWARPDSTNEMYGYIDRSGAVVIPATFHYAHDFSHGLAAVMKSTPTENRYGFINRRGEMVIPQKFEWAESFAGLGTARITVGGWHTEKNANLRWGLIDSTGEVIIEPVYEKLWYFEGSHPGNYVGGMRDGKRYVFDVGGRIVRED